MAEYKVQFEVFEGPLDLLLYLIKKEEVDIYEVNLTKLATQFVEHIETMRLLDLDIAGEFLVVAATLLYLKSRELLPKDQRARTGEEEEDGQDPRWELIRQLVEYKKFKDAAARLQELEFRQENTYPRLPPKIEFERDAAHGKGAAVFDLIHAVNQILRRFGGKENLREIFEDKWTVSGKIEDLRRRLASTPRLKFSELFASATSRAEVVVTFLAMLELIRLKVLAALQSEPFGDIELIHAGQPADAATPVMAATPGDAAWALDQAPTATA